MNKALSTLKNPTLINFFDTVLFMSVRCENQDEVLLAETELLIAELEVVRAALRSSEEARNIELGNKLEAEQQEQYLPAEATMTSDELDQELAYERHLLEVEAYADSLNYYGEME